MATHSDAAGEPASLRSQRPFAFFWCARLASTIAYQMQAVAVGWQVYDLTGSAFDLGMIGLVQFVPMALLTLAVGHVADRYDRRLVIRACQVVEAVAAATLAVGTFGGWITAEAIFAFVFILGSARAFEQPSLHALVPALVPPPLFSRAVAGSASANQTAIILGPALGGLIYIVGPAAVYATSAISFAVASVAVSFIRIDAPLRTADRPGFRSLFSGFVFIRQRPAVLGAISLDLVAVLLGGATALLPIYARDILIIGPWGLGLLRSAPALGALATSILLARHPLAWRAGPSLFVAVAAFGVATIVFAVSTVLPLSFVALAALGAADTVSVVIRFSLVQLQTPNELRGRVSAVNSMFIGASNSLGEFESGVTAAWFGAVPAALMGGMGTILVALVWLRAFPELVHTGRLEDLRRP
ncbi:MAG TPA: MFS transporter [Stellaceae bacterium]|nr:MFS transporter [Stellaceae bacterium]